MDDTTMTEELRKERAAAAIKPVAYFEKLTGRSMDGLPESLREGYARWWLFGIRAGSFLQAVIEGDLYEAMGQADHMNRARLFEIVSWFWNEGDSASIRSRATAWGDAGGYYGKRASRMSA